MKVLLGLLGYSCKIHRKRSKSSLNRFSFSESDEHRFERSFSNEEHKLGNDAENAHSEIHSSLSEPSTSTSTQSERNTEEKSALLTRDQKGKPEDKPAEETKANRQESTDAMAASFSEDDSLHKQVVIDHDETQEVNVPDIHHQYFTVATNFLKDAISESAKAPKCVSSMLAPHETLLQKIVHYASRITVYNALVSDLVASTLSISELSTLHKKLLERLYMPKGQSSSATEN